LTVHHQLGNVIQKNPCDKWVPVTTEWRVLGLRMEEWPPIWSVAANILNKHSRTADEGWFSSLGVGRGVRPPRENPCYDIFTRRDAFSGDKTIRR